VVHGNSGGGLFVPSSDFKKQELYAITSSILKVDEKAALYITIPDKIKWIKEQAEKLKCIPSKEPESFSK
jgi:hypothetical protein